MYQSTTYASQRNKSVFVEMAERSAKVARLVHEARAAETGEPAKQPRSLSHRAVSSCGQLLSRLGKRKTQFRAAAHS